ncbi:MULTISPECIES: DUF2523 family protein [Ralstonia]|uniref:DUF2523 family protein n=1 Tax=Ralstonia TaxID=48736 RepID=UPI00073EE5AC|nr:MULTISPECIES: DUF2523 family protein [Ralstonia]MBY4704199.1 DUF2523 domain-containing protein [Ralstonia insidiosa]GAQ30850.1 hypothetical protein SAMD00023378_4533 [Ralstonia sp. NT80]
MPFLALLGSAIVGALASACVSLVGRVLVALGLGFATYKGMDAAWKGIWTIFQGYMAQVAGGAFPQIVGIIALLKVPTCLNMMIATMAARAVVAGVTAGNLRRIVAK